METTAFRRVAPLTPSLLAIPASSSSHSAMHTEAAEGWHCAPAPRPPSSPAHRPSDLSLDTKRLQTAVPASTRTPGTPSPLVSPASGSSLDVPRTPDRADAIASPIAKSPSLTTLPASLHIRVRPIPHAVLPAPFSEFCLTPYLSSDADDMYELINHPQLARGLGVRPNAPFTRADAARTVRRAREKGHGWPLNALRRTSSLRTDYFPPLLGCITLARDDFRSLPHVLGERLRDAERAKADQDAHWAMQFSVDPALQGMGVMGAALRFILSAWFIPIINPYPGQLTTTFPAAALRAHSHNVSESPVARIHARLGFVPLGCVRGDVASIAGANDDVVCCAWMGAGAVRLESSVWGGLGLVPFSFDETDDDGQWEEWDAEDGVSTHIDSDEDSGCNPSAADLQADTEEDARRRRPCDSNHPGVEDGRDDRLRRGSRPASHESLLRRGRTSSGPHPDMEVNMA